MYVLKIFLNYFNIYLQIIYINESKAKMLIYSMIILKYFILTDIVESFFVFAITFIDKL